MKEQISKMQQINMLLEYANLNGISIKNFYTNRSDGTSFGNTIVYANIVGGGYLTIFCIEEDAKYKYDLTVEIYSVKDDDFINVVSREIF